MQLNKLAQILMVGVAVVALSACTHTKKNMGADGSYDDPYSRAQASGAGDGSKYGDANGTRKMASKDTYYFDFDRSEVRPADLPAIYAKADYLVAHPSAKIILEGHTDPRGSREYNVGLGERRALAVADILKSRGVSANQIRILSYGAERLAVAGHNEEAYQMDRRAITARLQG